MVAIDVVHVSAVVASVILAGVLLFAGVSKLAGDWRADVRAIGVPWVLAAPVPFVEIAIGALLVVQWQRRPVALAAIALLVVFTGFIALELSHGRRPTCACFGARSSARLGPGHLARNAIFIALGVLAAIG